MGHRAYNPYAINVAEAEWNKGPEDHIQDYRERMRETRKVRQMTLADLNPIQGPSSGDYEKLP